MIFGYFGNSIQIGQAKVSVMSSFLNVASVAKRYKSQLMQSNERVAFVVSLEEKLGIILGDSGTRSFYISHLKCDGASCECQAYARHFMSQPDAVDLDYEYARASLNEINFSPPSIIVLMKSEKTVVIQVLNNEEIQIRMVEPKELYLIRDFNFSRIYDTFVMNLSTPLADNIEDTKTVSRSLIDELQRKQMGWPLKCSGHGMTLLKDSQGTFLNTEDLTIGGPTAIGKRGGRSEALKSIKNDDRPSHSKPKGFVTGFNFYAKTKRNEVLENNEHLTNNQLNQLLGQRWKALPVKEKKPFEDMAKTDKERHKQEMRAYIAATASVNADLEGSLTIPGRPITAYNHFVHQEKQFVFGLEISDPQKKMGKHGGDRWNAITEAEKTLCATG